MYPPTDFHFRILFNGIEDPGQADSGFQLISGLEAHMDSIQKNKDLPSSPPGKEIRSVLILKRAARKHSESPLLRWFFSQLNSAEPAQLPGARIELLDENLEPFMAWTIINIFPKSWSLSELNAENSGVLTETIELFYEGLAVQDPGKK